MVDTQYAQSPLSRLVLFIVCLAIAGSLVAFWHYYAIDLPTQNNVIEPAKYPAGVLAIGTILLTLMAGIVGNIFIVLYDRLRKGNTQHITIIEKILLILATIFLIFLMAPFAKILIYTDFSTNPDLFFLCIGILFGVLGSVYSNIFSAAYDRHIDSKYVDNGWRNRDRISMIWSGTILLLYGGYLFWMFMQFK